MIPIAQIQNLLGYLELDLENRELENKSDWEETYDAIAVWLDSLRKPIPAGGLSKSLSKLETSVFWLEANVESLILVNDELHEKINAVETALKEHRKKAFVTCSEDCFCWSVEAVLNTMSKP